MSLHHLVMILLTAPISRGSHFRGGFFTWGPTNNESRIEISYRMSWRRSFSSNHFCNNSHILSNKLSPGEGSLECIQGCNGTVTELGYRCTDFSETEDWTTGTRTFIYNLNTTYPKIAFKFTSCCWINLEVGGEATWSMKSTASVIKRADTGKINSSPKTNIPPIIRVAHGCNTTINLLVFDPDGDTVRCRWSNGSEECGGMCFGLPGAVLNEETCTISYQANRNVSFYGVTIQVEDFPSSGGTVPYSSVPVQFLMNVYSTSQGCFSLPAFIPPTRADREVVYITVYNEYFDKIVAISNFPNISIEEITTVSPSGFIKSALAKYIDVPGAWYVNITWTPSTSDVNKMHIFCFSATDKMNLTSKQRCIDLIVLPDIIINATEGIPFYYGGMNGDSLVGANDGKCKLVSKEYEFPMFQSTHSKIYVCVTGIVTFDNPFESPGTVDGSELHGRAILAPYFTDIDTDSLKYGGNVYYHIYNSLKGDINISSNIQTAQKIIQEIHRDVGTFEAQFAIFVTWHQVLPSRAKLRQKERMNFQFALVTDGVYTFAFYVYLKDGMNLRSQQVYIGFTALDGQKYMDYRSFTSSVRSIDAKAIAFGYTGLLHYRLTFPTLGPKTSRQKCIDWYLSDRKNTYEYHQGLEKMPLCPCHPSHLEQDQFYSDIDIFTQGDAFCTYILPNWQFQPKSSGKTCCYNKTHRYFLGYGADSGGFLRYHPYKQALKHKSHDVEMRKACCEENDLCSLYHAVRPTGQCYTIFPAWHAPARGDPHFKTLDGQTFTFNGWGEFTLVKLNSSTEEFELQARTTKAMKKDGNISDATIFSAFAARHKNYASVHVEMSASKNGLIVYAKMAPDLALSDYTLDYMNLNNEFSVTSDYLSLSRNNETKNLKVVFSSGIAFTVGVSVKMLNINVWIPKKFRNMTSGLMGNFDGDPANDFWLKNGTVLSNKIKEKDIFNFLKTWAVDPDQSAFWYPRGKGYYDYSHLNYTPTFLEDVNVSKIASAREFCGEKEYECIFDLVFTEDEAVANETKRLVQISRELDNLLGNEVPSIDGPTIVNITVNTTLTYQVNAKDDGGFVYQLLEGQIYANITDQKNGTAVVTLLLKEDKPMTFMATVMDEDGVQATPHKPVIVLCSNCSNRGTCDFENYRYDDRATETFKYASCKCDPYWEGSTCERDRDGCATQPCSPLRKCTDIPANIHKSLGIGNNCSECPAGFTSTNDGRCEDVDECVSSNGSCSQICNNTYGSFICACFEGFRKVTGSNICQDIDECLQRTNDCGQICNNTIGGYNCSCYEGFVFNSAKRRCEVGHLSSACSSLNCSGTAGCATDVHGNATCFCEKGFQLSSDRKTCVDIDECQLPVCLHHCTNTEGSFYCSCFNGYNIESDKSSCKPCELPKYGENCNDTCECGQWAIRCDHVKGCICSKAWKGYKCDEDVDECLVPNICNDSFKVCGNTNGSYMCYCKDGFKLSASGSCEDVDECNDPDLNKCKQVCKNEAGGYTCGCFSGYKQSKNDTNSCQDIDECAVSQAGCEQLCQNSEGRYTCDCYFGYILNNDRKTCTKVEEPCATSGNITCSHICVRENGKVFCSCFIGYKLMSDNHSCEDFNECQDQKLNTCSNDCTNVNAGYICSCPNGLQLDNDGRTCKVCDPFHYGLNCSNLCNCGVHAKRCDPFTGCVCKEGWWGATCNEDIDECASNPCTGVNTACINTVGFYTCDCLPGFRNISGICQDIDECAGLHNCSHYCMNTEGSYRCACNEGFKNSESDHRTCIPCETDRYGKDCAFNCTCQKDNTQSCDNLNGTCSCREGWTGTTCDIDVDECFNLCSVLNKVCINSPGSFSCECKQGYRSDNDNQCIACTNSTFGINCSSPCACNISNSLNSSQTCNPVNGTCICNKGWTGDNCSQDINECEFKPGVCDMINNSGCYNVDGLFKCLCHIEYKPDGKGGCVEDVPKTTTPVTLESNHTSIDISITLDFNLHPSIDIKVPENYGIIVNLARDALSDFYRTEMDQMFIRIIITSIRRGSLVIDYNCIIQKLEEALLKLAEANAKLATRVKITLAGQISSAIRLTVEGNELPNSNNSDQLLCMSYISVKGDCASGQECKVIDKRPTCSPINKEDNFILIVAIGAGGGFLVLLILVIVVIVVCRRKSKEPMRRPSADNGRDDIPAPSCGGGTSSNSAPVEAVDGVSNPDYENVISHH